MTAFARPAVAAVLAQHVEDAAVLREVRRVLVRAPHVELNRLARHDERLAGHLDGVLVGGDGADRLVQAALETPSAGRLFVAAIAAIERRDAAQLDRLLALVPVLPASAHALASAVGWISPQALAGLALLQSEQAARRWLGLAACGAHRVDPRAALAAAVAAPDALLRTTALRTAAQVGRADQLPAVLVQLRSDDAPTRAAAAWAAVLLGDRREATAVLHALAAAGGEGAQEALQLALLAAEPEAARAAVRKLLGDKVPLRTAIRATGWAGDVQAVPWLIRQMADDAHARVAGEAFTLLTGADLAQHDLERKQATPEGADGSAPSAGPNDRAEDADVALDEDESLPWPDAARVHVWWQQHAGSLPSGGRCFMGGPAADAAHCRQVLATGRQRQRHAAALLLALREPGSVLFNVAAPAWRQQRALGLPMRVL